jgi:hypothetical protein
MTPSSFSEPTHLSEEDKLSFTTAHVIKVYEPTPKLAPYPIAPLKIYHYWSPSESSFRPWPCDPISSPGEEEQFYLAGTTKENERGRQNHAPSLDHNIIGKRRRAVSYPSVPDSPSPDDDGLTRAYDRGNACGQDERCNGIDAAEGNLLNGREDFRTSLNGKLNPR